MGDSEEASFIDVRWRRIGARWVLEDKRVFRRNIFLSESVKPGRSIYFSICYYFCKINIFQPDILQYVIIVCLSACSLFLFEATVSAFSLSWYICDRKEKRNTRILNFAFQYRSTERWPSGLAGRG